MFTTKQKKAISKLHHLNGGAVWWRVGRGKTRIALGIFATIAKEVAHDFVQDSEFNLKPSYHSTFIVVCRREAFYDWKREVKKLKLNWEIYEYEGGDMPLIYLNLTQLLLVSHGMLSKVANTLKDYGSQIHGICYDEGFLFKNPASDHCKAAHTLSKAIGTALILSGSIMTARDLTDVYGQLYAIDRQYVLARTLTEFRSRYMSQLWIGSVPKLVNRRHAVKRVAQKIREVASIYFPKDSERQNLTDIKKIDPLPSQTDAIKKLKEEYWIKLKGKELELRNAPSLIAKCQQISDGWLKMNDGTIVTMQSSKLAQLMVILEELMAAKERVVIWCAFRHSVETILQSLQNVVKEGYAVGMHGSLPFDIDTWNATGCIAVATEASGSSVNYFSQCAYAIYYSMDFKWLNFQQSKGRTNRYDSLHRKCYYYFLQIRGTLDNYVYRIAHRSGRHEERLLNLAKLRQWLTKP